MTAMICAVAAAVVLTLVAAGGFSSEARSPYPHCAGVSFDEALYIVGRMNEARESHDFWAVEGPRRGLEATVGDPSWHLGWSDTYVRANNLLALTLRGCI